MASVLRIPCALALSVNTVSNAETPLAYGTREEYLGILAELSRCKEQLKGELDNLRLHYDKMKAFIFNLQLKAREREGSSCRFIFIEYQQNCSEFEPKAVEKRTVLPSCALETYSVSRDILYLHCAIESGQADVIELLVKKGVDFEAQTNKTNKGVTALQIAETLHSIRIIIVHGDAIKEGVG
ncbi:hypothetical protein HHK36_023657 [Tetracentron sinense]|uniref:Uncharacterized protein n=1 Tax=Tetracentron sinense TaxID=13715 RepID=A0A835D5F0_TETSI|nr:hypothetical protein HHK36_023657 [Tetracentron sinense]